MPRRFVRLSCRLPDEAGPASRAYSLMSTSAKDVPQHGPPVCHERIPHHPTLPFPLARERRSRGCARHGRRRMDRRKSRRRRILDVVAPFLARRRGSRRRILHASRTESSLRTGRRPVGPAPRASGSQTAPAAACPRAPGPTSRRLTETPADRAAAVSPSLRKELLTANEKGGPASTEPPFLSVEKAIRLPEGPPLRPPPSPARDAASARSG